MSIFDFVPAGYELRRQQREILEQVEQGWATHDVIAINAPTAVGKTLVEYMIAAWSGQAVICVPTNTLLAQIEAEFPGIVTLWKKGHYYCPILKDKCRALSKKQKLQYCCGPCATQDALEQARAAPVAVMNYHTYLAHRMYAPVVLFDEGHGAPKLIQEMAARKLWKSDYGFPEQMYTYADLLSWVERHPKLDDPKFRTLHSELLTSDPTKLIEYGREWRRGKNPEQVLKLIPLNIAREKPYLWPPRKVDKIVLLSATIGIQDVRDMGLDHRRRVLCIETDSPIPAASRLVKYEPTANMSYAYQDLSMPKMAAKIRSLLQQHPEKGMLHLTYGVSRKLRELLRDEPRLLWHRSENAKEVYSQFLESPPSAGMVLCGCGLEEGIDLADDLGRWQAIIKLPYLSLADSAIKARAAQDNNWYQWQAVRKVLQACGRICRGPTDYGVTYILDSTFGNLYRKNKALFPVWFKSALVGVE